MSEATLQTIVSSQTVKDLVIASGLQFLSIGTRELRGVPGSWLLYSVSSL